MPVTSDFDKYFLNLPPFDREEDFNNFWEKSINELKKIPIEPKFTHRKNGSGDFEVYDIVFKGYNRSISQGILYAPRHINKPRVIMIFPDYFSVNPYLNYKLDKDFAYFFLQLRGHHLVTPGMLEEEKSPGYMADNLDQPDNYYMKGIYLDAYRSLDMLRLYNKLDCSAVGIIGKGLGAAAAVFTASFSNRIVGLVLDTPSFCYLAESQNCSSSPATLEINEFISQRKSKKKEIKQNLSYFDALNFSDKIKIPALVTVGFKDTLSPPGCVFALFNHLICDKTVEVYPESGNEAGGEEQFKKSMKWMKETIRKSTL